ncbi:MAG: hypothetical protein AAGA46_02695 [Cyanobacteria bacterium P01_F01_bin.13]
MLTPEELTELKYQEILEYQEVVTNAALDNIVLSTANTQISCFATAIFTSLIMGCCAMVFTPNPNRKKQR